MRTGRSRVVEVQCLNREGWLMPGLDLGLFRKLKRRRAIGSRDGRPYRITRRGLELVRSQLDNRDPPRPGALGVAPG